MYPEVKDKAKIGSYPALTKAGGGYVWDEVLEYRVWCYVCDGAEDLAEGSDYFYPFATYEEAASFQQEESSSRRLLALVLQKEYIDEPEPEQYYHRKEERITEWQVEYLRRPRRTRSTIPKFMSPDAPANRLDIIRGTAK